MVPGGIVLAVTNLDNYTDQSGPLCLVSRLCPLPNAELYICAVIESEKERVAARLEEMMAKFKAKDPLFGERNNNTSVCLASDQKLYFYNKKISEIESPVQDYLGGPVAIDKFYYSVYSPHSRPNEKTLLKSLIAGISEFVGADKVVEVDTWGRFGFLPSAIVPMHEPIEKLVPDFVSCAAVGNLKASKIMVGRFAASLWAKRFLILTGLSGSGKTKLAHAFAAWLSESEAQYRLVAVGADWTTNENVVGYQDALQSNIYRKPSNGLLDVILRARDDKDRPYFLILDEMNLSHVERYFADILSAIESRQEIALHSSANDLEAFEKDPLPVPSKIRLPKNLFIIGTVNVDETTYMFSPKVLDRANVIEFRATAGDISAFLDNPSAINMDMLAGQGAQFGAAFVAEAAAEVQLKSETAVALKERLAEVFAALAPIGAEFGFRTAYEITRFTYYHEKLTGDGWQFNEALDAQVLQKLMPKLHGSRRKLEPVLNTLEAFCTTHQCNASLEKIDRMQKRLERDGFTSFAEA
jgi:energy-coupling factor transporter ATP-binding protein EcfA2